VTVQVAEPPEVNDAGAQLKVDTPCVGTTDKEVVCEAAPNVAVSVTVSLAVSAPAAAVKVAEATPAGTVTLAGSVTRELLSDSATMAPPDAAGWFKVTVQVLLLPETIVPGLQATDETSIGATRLKEAV
jgi:hypothetical protein